MLEVGPWDVTQEMLWILRVFVEDFFYVTFKVILGTFHNLSVLYLATIIVS